MCVGGEGRRGCRAKVLATFLKMWLFFSLSLCSLRDSRMDEGSTCGWNVNSIRTSSALSTDTCLHASLICTIIMFSYILTYMLFIHVRIQCITLLVHTGM